MTDKQMLAVYRHDAHKMTGQSHDVAPSEWFGVPVNQDVPYGADSDAAAMSRPRGEPEQVLEGHETHYRRDLRTGETAYDATSFSLHVYRDKLETILTESDAERMYRRWLTESTVLGGFNESVYYPYTSLKYHTLLVGALVDCYRNGHEFDNLGLWLTTANEQTTYRTIFTHDDPQFRLTIRPHQRPESAKLSSYPLRNFASVWQRLPEHPWPEYSGLYRVIDSQLRRIQSWSTALQYLENTLQAGEIHA